MKFSIPGKPKALVRPRRVSKGGKSWWYDPSKKDKDNIAFLAIEARAKMHPAQGLKGYLMACMTFYCANILRIDVDNGVKLILDALNKVIYEDDSYVVKIIASKVICQPKEERTTVEIFPVEV